MTVKELIEELRQADPNQPVTVWTQEGERLEVVEVDASISDLIEINTGEAV